MNPEREQNSAALFPAEAVVGVLYKGEWIDVKSGSMREFQTEYGIYVQFIDPADGLITFLFDRLIEGWKVDPQLVVLTGDGKQSPQIPKGVE